MDSGAGSGIQALIPGDSASQLSWKVADIWLGMPARILALSREVSDVSSEVTRVTGGLQGALGTRLTELDRIGKHLITNVAARASRTSPST